MNACKRLLVLVSATLALSAANAQDKVVNVYNWSDYITPEAIDGFTKETGIRVVYDVYDSNEVLEAKLLTGKSGYDVVFSAARPYAARQVQAKLLLPLNKTKLTNLKNINAGMLTSLKDFDAGNQYTVPYMWGTTGLGINVKKVQALLGKDAPLDSWNLMFDPIIAKKLSSCGISILDDDAEGLGAIMVSLGKAPQSASAADITAASNRVKAVRPYVRYFHSSRYISDLASGETCLAMGYSGDILQAKARAIDAKNGAEIRYVIPREGTVRWMDLMMIPKDATHVDAAHQFINYLMRPDVIAQISGFVGYANPNDAARPLMDKALLEDPGVYPGSNVKLIDNQVITSTQKSVRTRAWTKMKAGRDL
jgi:putrescine transport system substrate-binding protein